MSSQKSLGPHDLYSVLLAVPQVVVVIDRDHIIRFVNHTSEGYARQDVIGQRTTEFIEEDFQESFEETINGVFENGVPAQYEIPIYDADGEREWHEGTVTPIVEGGRVSLVVVVTVNVTERHRAQEEVEMLRRLVPVCSWCNKVQDEDGSWQELEQYVESQSKSKVTHSMCPECRKKMLDSNSETA